MPAELFEKFNKIDPNVTKTIKGGGEKNATIKLAKNML